MRVLVVDDSSTMRRIITSALNKLGHEDVMEAANGKEGIQRLSDGKSVDLIITDWNMPEMGGLDFVRALRTLDGCGAVPVLMITTNAAQDDIVKAMQAGVNNYIVKPFSPETLKDKVSKVLQKAA